MTQEDFQKFATIMTAAAETVGKKAPGEGALGLSFAALKKYSKEQKRVTNVTLFCSNGGGSEGLRSKKIKYRFGMEGSNPRG